MKTGAGEWAVAIVVGLLLYGLLASSVFLTDWKLHGGPMEEPAVSRNSDQIGEALLGLEAATPPADLTVINRPRTKVSYLLLFEIVSVHLLVVLLGAAYLARAKRRKVTVT
jgi:NADH-quinone oxidoreductase subunit J